MKNLRKNKKQTGFIDPISLFLILTSFVIGYSITPAIKQTIETQVEQRVEKTELPKD